MTPFSNGSSLSDTEERLHREGHELNPFVFTSILKVLVSMECAELGWNLHSCICKLGHESNAFVGTALIDAYSVCGCVDFAREVFDGIRCKDMVTWTGMACIGLEAFDVAKGVHGCVLKTRYEHDIYLEVALLELYTKCGNIGNAQWDFEEIPKKYVISWSFKISWFARSDQSEEVINLFCRMRQAFVVPIQFTFASALQACATVGDLDLGKQMHGLVFRVGLDVDVFVSNALINVYAKCGRVEDSMELVLCASASLAALEQGTEIHSLTVKTNYAENTVVHNALIDMYAKCGRIRDARLIFDMMNERDEVSWNAMISGYSMHGLGMEALKIFQMMQDRGYKPNTLTFVGVLSACSNSGLLDQGQAYFTSMIQDYGIEPCIEHYSCMVWLLGKSGHLYKAVKLIEEIPFEPSVMVWRALLGACVIHNNVELGRLSSQCILEMEPLMMQPMCYCRICMLLQRGGRMSLTLGKT
ncbi:hypothetical protein CRYUN_Cryun04dG0119500 [Craigia yunnanensis]